MTHPLSSADISILSPEISNFCYIKKHRYRLHVNAQFRILLTLLQSSKAALINMIAILMMWAKLTALGLLKVKLFWNKGYEVIISVHDVISKILSRVSNYVVDVVMWPKFCCSSSTSMRKVTIPPILKGFDQKNEFFWGVLLV